MNRYVVNLSFHAAKDVFAETKEEALEAARDMLDARSVVSTPAAAVSPIPQEDCDFIAAAPEIAETHERKSVWSVVNIDHTPDSDDVDVAVRMSWEAAVADAVTRIFERMAIRKLQLGEGWEKVARKALEDGGFVTVHEDPYGKDMAIVGTDTFRNRNCIKWFEWRIEQAELEL